ncbi:MAG: DUF3226 domain-containing protein [Chloroflexota bacterium]
MPTKTNADAYLLVEGVNDKHVVWALCEAHKISESFVVQEPKDTNHRSGGMSQLMNTFRLQLRSSDLKALGLVLDADQNIHALWQSITNTIQQEHPDTYVPAEPSPNGTIIESGADYIPKIGIWIMPNNQDLGDLEAFLRFLVPEDDKLVPYAESTLQEIEKEQLNLYRHKRTKALIHTWLAWQDEPGRPLGQSITAKALSADSPLALEFVNWLNQLFNADR